jgi:PAS domain S-box-containing protein
VLVSAPAAALTALMLHVSGGKHAIAALLAAIFLSGWYAGAGPAGLAVVLAMVADRALPNVLGTHDSWSLSIRDSWFAFVAIAGAHFGAHRRRAEEFRRSASDRLEREVEARTRELLRRENYRNAAESLSHTGGWIFPTSERPYFWSDETFRILGLNPATTPPDLQRLYELVTPSDLPRFARVREAAIREHRPYDIECRIRRPDGEMRRLRTIGMPSFDERGEIVEYVGVVMDVTDRRRTERALQRSRERNMHMRFAARLAERNRIAREMHDTLLQGFTGVALQLVAVAHRLEHQTSEGAHELQPVIALAQRTLEDARRAIWDMRAPQSTDALATRVRAAADEVTRTTGVEVRAATMGEPRALGSTIDAVVLRVTREAVANVVKHADVHEVRVTLRYGRRAVRLIVSDRGRGFVVAPDVSAYGGHLGLLGMRERASEVGGRFAVHAAPGLGTRVVLTVPYGRIRESGSALDDGVTDAPPVQPSVVS